VSYFQQNDVLAFENCRLPVDECLGNAYFSGDYEGKKHLGKNKRRWDYNIKV